MEYEKYVVDEAEDGESGLAKIKANKYDLIMCDIKMPKMDGLDVLKHTVSAGIETPLVMISGHGTIETAVEAIKNGAFDFISKPFDLNRLLITVRNAIDKKELVQETRKLQKKVGGKGKTQIIGESEGILKVKEMIDKVAVSDARVLITGGNGTGKELVARSLHEKSERSKAPFIEVNCAAIPSELIESELFGHEKGAFTSAIKQRKGCFEQAEGGTLFLDEIGDMSLSAQAKVLRALQENKITRVGGEKEISVNVRVLAATNKDLMKEIAEGNFREDLYHRLGVILIHVPSLNDRKEDVPLLADYFLTQLCNDHGIAKKAIDSKALEKLKEYDWSGNIRELRNVVERLIILSGKTITVDDVMMYANPGKK
ncbi:sigma-54-dependent transcriptional regulator [Acinetobacter baumannii]|uniref:sigma-54-dependent transcriptional regulator n=1 Tax=Acinetobacter baumannii TaxID=470 RepID=UPI001BD00496|nr:sigma-54 dependent transcriptional regulator [Acinetobacter baumannii]MCJ8793785.1 sigma-54 dependent transcriptional regulator [Acinetobacter baumannii]MCJ8878398.1 sigma-54 dependent transcriptional regulator [Acinetobacter baumannii]MCJ8903842.1 sigma-54 dependent transcriptional regulator [Acinetobacter baumannii]HCW4261484.1 sigma-54-dependent Fis family transcriptional regulator [Acinetobacter baumannii]HCW4261768.1 sigma-54-dependent Fis family transcriptional regulator [Acinetobacte